MTETIYLIRSWDKSNDNELHERAFGVASSLEHAKEMINQRWTVEEWTLLKWGVYSTYVLPKKEIEITINILQLDKQS